MYIKTPTVRQVFFTKNIHRLKWLFMLNTLILLVFYPITLFFAHHNRVAQVESVENLFVISQSMLTLNTVTIASLSIAIFPVLYALISFSYLQNIGDSVRTHSMPIKREQLFTTHAASGLLATWLPYCITAVAFLGLQVLLPPGCIPINLLGKWLLVCLLFSSIFFTSTVLAGMIIGNSILQGVFVYIMLLLPAGIQSLLAQNLSIVMKGYVGDGAYWLMYCSPLAAYMMILKRNGLAYLPTWFWLLQVCYLVFFTLGAYYLYRKRKLENVGQTIQFSQLTPILRTLGVFCFMLLSGLIIKDIAQQNIALIPGYLLGGILSYVLLEMIIQKQIQCRLSFKEINWMLLCFLICFGIIAFDVTQYGQKTMPSEDIEAIYFSPTSTYLTKDSQRLRFEDPETIQAIERLYAHSIQSVPSTYWLNSKKYSDALHFIFVNKNGQSFKRTLYVDPHALEQELAAVLKTKAFFQSQHPALLLMANEVESVRLDTPLGKMIFSDPVMIQKLVHAAQKETYAQKLPPLDRSIYPLATLSFTISNKASSYPFREDALASDEMRVECNLNLYPNFKETYALLLESKKASDMLITPDKISKILLKPVSESSDSSFDLNREMKLTEKDPNVRCIDDAKSIQAFMKHPLFHDRHALNDYQVNYLLKADPTAYIAGYSLETY